MIDAIITRLGRERRCSAGLLGVWLSQRESLNSRVNPPRDDVGVFGDFAMEELLILRSFFFYILKNSKIIAEIGVYYVRN